MTGQFSDKVALVTAAADGIGAATAKAFAEHGAKVVLSDINTELGEERAEALRAAGHQALFLRADATAEDEVEALVQRTVEHFGRSEERRVGKERRSRGPPDQ